MKNLILTIQRVAKGGEPQFGLFRSRNHENSSLVPSINSAIKILKWKPKVELLNGLAKTKIFMTKYGK